MARASQHNGVRIPVGAVILGRRLSGAVIREIPAIVRPKRSVGTLKGVL